MKKHLPPFVNRRRFLQLSSVAGLLVPTASVLGQSNYVVAETTFGRVRGLRADGVNIFKGIPYGADTGGRNRFMPPQNPVSWTGIKDTFDYGPAAPQSDPASGLVQDGAESEDCLVLNIWTQGLNDGAKRPVMFWCHGGGFNRLSGASPRYDGTNLSLRGDVVVVTINHRLNMMGYTHFGDLDDEFAVSGTVGMQDIVHALKWVQNNIEQFGGDPDRVLLFGESGGGRKVGTLLAMPSANGLYHRAMIESGAALRFPEREHGTRMAELMLSKLGLSKNNIRAIQDVPLRNIMAAYHSLLNEPDVSDVGGGVFVPIPDDNVLPYHPFYPEAAPVNPNIPVIIGANRTEMTFYATDADFQIDERSMTEKIRELVGENNVRDVIDAYREANPDAPPWEIYFLVYSDSRYVMPSITMAERRSALTDAPVYLYYLTWESSAKNGRILSPHTLDIPFVFDNVRSNALTMDSPRAIPLADKISDSIIGFARTGSPDVGKLPIWKPFNSASRATMVWNDVSEVVNDPIRQQREIIQPILNL